jgi:hypothetical protein
MAKEELLQIANKYRALAIFKGGEFLLQPSQMVEYIDDLSNAGVLIYGCNLWRYLDPSKDPNRIVELIGAGINVTRGRTKDNLLSVEQSAEIVRDFVKNKLPEDAELVSLTAEDDDVHRMIRSE